MRSATEIDRRVGKNLSIFRQLRDISQGTLAEAVGITFQQIQKYEKGINRISVSRLWQLSQVLGIPVEQFYSGVLVKGLLPLALTARHLSLLRKYDGLSEVKKQALFEYMQFLQRHPSSRRNA